MIPTKKIEQTITEQKNAEPLISRPLANFGMVGLFILMTLLPCWLQAFLIACICGIVSMKRHNLLTNIVALFVIAVGIISILEPLPEQLYKTISACEVGLIIHMLYLSIVSVLVKQFSWGDWKSGTIIIVACITSTILLLLLNGLDISYLMWGAILVMANIQFLVSYNRESTVSNIICSTIELKFVLFVITIVAAIAIRL